MEVYNYTGFGQCDGAVADFWSVAKVGTQAPDFTLADLDGNAVSLSALKGSPILLEFGSVT
jgi:cytochrome oxidase Cu insertion factor (SCO1/SenC/PrrC family)